MAPPSSGQTWVSISVLSLILCVELILCNEYDCSWSDSVLNSSFDLCLLVKNNESMYTYYDVDDKRATNNVTKFEYYFNVAADIVVADDGSDKFTTSYETCYDTETRSSKSLPLGYCSNIQDGTCDSGDISVINVTTAGYQYRVENEACYRLHDGVTAPTWSLINDGDPTKGVQITYYNGDWCANSGNGKNRELTLVFHCSDQYSTFSKNEQIEEYDTCSYAIELYSIHGCPLGCPFVSGAGDDEPKLCNGQGVCEYDFSNNRSKCFCYEGYYGDDCVDTSDPDQVTIYNDDDEQYVGGLIIVVILLVVMLAILTYLWLRLDRVKKGIVKTDVVKKLVSKKSRGPQLQSIDNVKDDSYDDDERVAV